MLDAATVIRAGGIVPIEQPVPEGERVGEVSARAYVHPALPDRVVVKLPADAVAPAVDLELETLGFGAPTVRTGLGRQRFRALGFPGWALLNDPKHARYALDVMGPFKKAAKLAKSKPGHGRDAFVAIAERLGRGVPHFLPSFWEQAGRVYLEEESTSFAAQCFEKARQAEDAHGLAVDEDLRSSVYLEFALAGAVSARSLTGYAKDLAKAFGPVEAYPRYFELASRRLLGGVPPWTGMAKDLRAAAKAAKRDVDAEDERFLRETIEASGLVRAPAEFWKTYRPALERVAAQSADVRTRLRGLFPRTSLWNNPLPPLWIEILESTGALRAVTEIAGDDAAREPKGAPAAWLTRLIEYAPHEPAVLRVMDAMVARLKADGVPLSLTSTRGSWHMLDLDVCEHALASGLDVADLLAGSAFDFRHQLPKLDPVHVAADPRFARLLDDAVGHTFGQPAFEAATRSKVGFAQARARWLDAQIDGARGGGLPALDTLVQTLANRTDAATFHTMAPQHARLLQIDATPAVAETLRTGIFAEFTWPAYEAALAELGAVARGRALGSLPHLVIANSTRAVVLGANGRTLEHDFVFPGPVQLQGCLYAGGQLLVTFWDRARSQSVRYWSGAPTETFEAEPEGGTLGVDPRLSAHLPDGLTSLGARGFRPGDTHIGMAQGFAWDGQTGWASFYDTGTYMLRWREVDLRTGTAGRSSWPAFIERYLQANPAATVGMMSFAPLPEGAEATPLGTAEGLVGGAWVGTGHDRGSTFLHVDGTVSRTTRTHHQIAALVHFPGGAVPRPVVRGGYQHKIEIVNERGETTSSVAEGDPTVFGWPAIPPVSHWHFLRTRDEAGSAALRTLTDDTVRALLAASDGDGKKLTDALKRHLPTVTDATLLQAVGKVVSAGAGLHARLVALANERTPTASPEESVRCGAVDDAQVRAALGALVPSTWGDGAWSHEFDAVNEAMNGGALRPFKGSRVLWETWVGRERALAAYAVTVGVSEASRSVIASMLARWQHSVFAKGDARVRHALVRIAAKSPLEAPAQGQGHATSWLHRIDGHTYFLRAVTYSDGRPEQVSLLECAGSAEPVLPPGVTVEHESPPSRGASAPWLGAFLETLAARGAPTWDPSVIPALAEATGLTQTEAALWRAGLPGGPRRHGDFLGKPLREQLGVKTSEAGVAIETFKSLDPSDLVALFDGIAPDDPRALWSPEIETRYADAWVAHVGKRVALREDLLAAVQKDMAVEVAPATLLGALLDAAHAPLLQPRAVTFEEALAGAYVYGSKATEFDARVVVATAKLLPYLFVTLPVGDPYRNAIPAMYRAIRAALADPRTLLPVCSPWADPTAKAQRAALLEGIGGTEIPVRQHDGTAGAGRDNGVLMGITHLQGGSFRVVVRTANVKDPAAESMLWKLAALGGAHGTPEAFGFLRSPGFEALVARVENTPVPVGGWETDPRASCPELVATVCAARGLSESAAVLYLQLLALPEPITRHVLTWNGWKAAEHKKAVAELAAKGLVVEGKRERAGREVFLPGGWTKRAAPNLPSEPWKDAHLALPFWPIGLAVIPRPVHELFAAAWARVAAGDVPKLDEVT